MIIEYKNLDSWNPEFISTDATKQPEYRIIQTSFETTL